MKIRVVSCLLVTTLGVTAGCASMTDQAAYLTGVGAVAGVAAVSGEPEAAAAVMQQGLMTSSAATAAPGTSTVQSFHYTPPPAAKKPQPVGAGRSLPPLGNPQSMYEIYMESAKQFEAAGDHANAARMRAEANKLR